MSTKFSFLELGVHDLVGRFVGICVCVYGFEFDVLRDEGQRLLLNGQQTPMARVPALPSFRLSTTRRMFYDPN